MVLNSAGDNATCPRSSGKSPGALYLVSGKEGVLLLPLVRCGRTSLCDVAARCVRRTAGPGRLPVGLRMQSPNEKFFTLFSEAGSNIVDSVAISLAARSGSVVAAVAV